MTEDDEEDRSPLDFVKLPPTPKSIHDMNDDELTEFVMPMAEALDDAMERARSIIQRDDEAGAGAGQVDLRRLHQPRFDLLRLTTTFRASAAAVSDRTAEDLA